MMPIAKMTPTTMATIAPPVKPSSVAPLVDLPANEIFLLDGAGVGGAGVGAGEQALEGAAVVAVVVIMKAGAVASQMRCSRHAHESALSVLSERRLRWLPSTWLLAASMSATSSLDPCG